MNERLKNLAKALGIIVGVLFLTAVAADIYVIIIGTRAIYDNTNDLPPAQAVLVLGASVYRSGQMSNIFQDRARVALEIYRQKKAQKILVSGDYHRGDYDEVSAAQKFFLENGVASQDLFIDYAGFDTYSSIYRAKEVFQVESMIVSTQEFHLPRALYLAQILGIKAYGIKTDLQNHNLDIKNILRENAARAKAFWNINTGARPPFPGKIIPITGDGQASWQQ